MKDLPRFMVDGRSVVARLLVGITLFDLVLPHDFDNTANEWRPRSHDSCWMRLYIGTYPADQLWPEPDKRIQPSSWQEARCAWQKFGPKESAMTFADLMAALGTEAPFMARSRRSNLPWMRR